MNICKLVLANQQKEPVTTDNLLRLHPQLRGVRKVEPGYVILS